MSDHQWVHVTPQLCAVGLQWWAFGQDSDACWGGADSRDGPMAHFCVEEPACEWSDRYHDRVGTLVSIYFSHSLLFSSLPYSLFPPLTLPLPFLPPPLSPSGTWARGSRRCSLACHQQLFQCRLRCPGGPWFSLRKRYWIDGGGLYTFIFRVYSLCTRAYKKIHFFCLWIWNVPTPELQCTV